MTTGRDPNPIRRARELFDELEAMEGPDAGEVVGQLWRINRQLVDAVELLEAALSDIIWGPETKG